MHNVKFPSVPFNLFMVESESFTAINNNFPKNKIEQSEECGYISPFFSINKLWTNHMSLLNKNRPIGSLNSDQSVSPIKTSTIWKPARRPSRFFSLKQNRPMGSQNSDQSGFSYINVGLFEMCTAINQISPLSQTRPIGNPNSDYSGFS